MSGWRAGLCGLLAYLSSGCAVPERPPLPDPTQRGERVEIAAPALTLCAGTLAHFDAFVAELEATLDLRRPGRARVYVLEDDDHVAELCGGRRRGRCYDGRLRASVVARSALAEGVIEHELVHDLADHSAVGALPPLLGEGFATLFSWQWAPRVEASHTPLAFLLDLGPSASLQNDEYVLGALLLQWLLDRFGKPAVLSFLGALEQESDAAAVAAAADEHLTERFDVIAAQFEADRAQVIPDCTRCRQTPERVSERWRMPLRFDCSEPSTSDDLSSPGPGLRASAVIATERVATFQVVAPAGITFAISGCDCREPEDRPAAAEEPVTRRLTAGQHLLRAFAERAIDAEFRPIELRRIGD